MFKIVDDHDHDDHDHDDHGHLAMSYKLTYEPLSQVS